MLCKRTCLVLPIHWIFPVLFWRVFLIWQLTCSVWPSRTRNSASWPIRQSWGLLFSVLTFNPISAVSRQAAAACLVGHKQLRLLLCRLLLPCLTEHAPYTTVFECFATLDYQTIMKNSRWYDDHHGILLNDIMIIILPCLTEHMPYRLTPLDWLLDIPWTICGTFCYR